VLVSEFPQIIPRNITSRSNVSTACVRPRSLGCTLHVPFFLSRLPMAEEFFRSGIWRCGKSPGAKTCYTFTAISSTEHQTHVGLLSINALRHNTNVTLGMERTILFLLSCPRQSAALLLCHCGSHSPKRLTDWRAETFADCHAVPMSVVSM